MDKFLLNLTFYPRRYTLSAKIIVKRKKNKSKLSFKSIIAPEKIVHPDSWKDDIRSTFQKWNAQNTPRLCAVVS